MNNDACTRVIFGSEARKSLFKGLEIVAESVSSTLGPRGKCVLIQQQGDAPPVVTKDGVTVSKSIHLKDPILSMGAKLIREAASQTNDTAGDGTTTSTVLTHSMVKEGLKLLESGYASKELCDGINIATSAVIKQLISSSKQLTTSEEVAQIATISANGDKAIGELISDAMTKVGHDGIITVEDAKGMLTSLDISEGMQIDRGYLSPYFVTNSEKMNVSYSDARVLLVDHKLNSMKDMIPILEKVMQSKTPLLIIADEVEGEALQGLVVNRVNASLPVVAIKSPGYGQHKEDLLRDISILTGAKIVSSSSGLSLQKLTMSDLGKLSRVVVDAKSSTLVATGTTKQEIEKQIEDLRCQLKDITLTQDEAMKLKMRIAKLASGVAVIRVGGATEVEMIERKYRIEDALNATRAAVEEGIVPGGGIALVRASEELKDTFDADLTRGQAIGASIVMKACFAPLRRIAENSGKSADVILSDLSRHYFSSDIPYQFRGYDAENDKQVDMMQSGIIDPVLVTRTALKNAASVTVTFLSLDAVIVDEVSNYDKNSSASV